MTDINRKPSTGASASIGSPGSAHHNNHTPHLQHLGIPSLQQQHSSQPYSANTSSPHLSSPHQTLPSLSTDDILFGGSTQPLPAMSRQPQQQQPSSAQMPPIDHLQFSQHHDQTTLVLGVLGYVDRLEREISDLRSFVNTGFKTLNDVGQMDGGLSTKVETIRLQSRNWNRTNVTELEEQFRLLPMSNGEFPGDIPSTGQILRDVGHKIVDYLLDLYDIPFVPTMFLMEKKMLYLKFIGANRVVQHRILD